MKRLALLLVLAMSARAEDADVAKGLQTLQGIYAIAQFLEVRLPYGITPKFDAPIPDPWGTPYRIDLDANRIVSAGSDGKFDEASWKEPAQFANFEGDVVFQNGAWIRTNHNWLCRQVTPGSANARELAKMRTAEFIFMNMRTPAGRVVTGTRVTSTNIESIAALVEEYRREKGSLAGLTLDWVSAHSPQRITVDAWGTPLRLAIDEESYTILSAGSDRNFDEGEDIIYADGRYTQRLDEKEYVKNAGVQTGEAVKQPADARLEGTRVGALINEANFTPPVAVARIEPDYPETYRKLRISGIVILEVALSETGEVGPIAVVKSIGPAIDMAAVDAVRKWKFTPAKRGDQAVPVLFMLTLNFKLT